MPLVKYDPAGRNCLPSLFFLSLSQRTHAPLCLYRWAYSRQRVLLHACLVRAAERIRYVSSLQSCALFFFLHIGVVYCYHHVCVVLWLHRSDNCLSVWIGCLWTRCCHRHEAIVVTLRFNCHTWICRWSKRFSRGSFLYVHFYNSWLFFTHQEPVMEKQMPFLCPVMGAEAVCVCMQEEVGLFRRSKLFTSAFHCIWLVCNGRQCHPGPDIRLMYGGERDRWVCPFPF